MYIIVYKAVYYGLRVQDQKENLISNATLKDRVTQDFPNGNAVAQRNSDWLICYYYDPKTNQKVINFQNWNETTFSFIDQKSLTTRVDQLYQHLDAIQHRFKHECL